MRANAEPALHNALSRRGFMAGALTMIGGTMAGAMVHPSPLWASVITWPGVGRLVVDNVTQGRVAGAVAAMGVGQAEPEYISRGVRTLGRPETVEAGSLFRIYSMTKPITGMAAMMLIEDGLLQLDQPISDILPQFARMQVQRVADGPLDDVVPAKHAITIRHLLTHTAGFGYSFIQKGPIKTAYVKEGLVPGAINRLPLPGFSRAAGVTSLSQFADRLARLPLVYQPGTKWSYSLSLDLLGHIIEIVSGETLEAFFRKRFFEPLDMHSTWFQVPRAAARRLTTNYGVLEGMLVPIDPAGLSVYLDPAPVAFGGSGLVSSPRDYDRFLRMLLGLGQFRGRRVMGEDAVRLATSNLLPKGVSTAGTMANGGGFGAGGRVGLGAEDGTFGWGGAAGTIGFVDLKRGWRGGLYAQYMPAEALSLQREFPQIAMRDALRHRGIGDNRQGAAMDDMK